MSGKSLNHQVTTIQKVEYKGILPPPEMLRKFQEIDPALLNKIVNMADRSMDFSATELANQSKELDRLQFEAETSAQDLVEKTHTERRGQLMAFTTVILVLAVTVFLAERGLAAVAIAVATGGFASMIMNTIRGTGKKE
jgi:uncharacterized membrane protein